MDREFFIREIEAHSGMMYRVAYTILRNDDACRTLRSRPGKNGIPFGKKLFFVPG